VSYRRLRAAMQRSTDAYWTAEVCGQRSQYRVDPEMDPLRSLSATTESPTPPAIGRANMAAGSMLRPGSHGRGHRPEASLRGH
jgi:hypothetical protein